LNQFLDTADCPRSDTIEPSLGLRVGVVLQAFSPDLDRREAALTRDFLQERPLLGHGFEQRRDEVWEDNLQGQTWEAGAAAHIKQESVEAMPSGKIQALSKVPCDAFLRRGDGNQIDAAVPREQRIEVG